MEVKLRDGDYIPDGLGGVVRLGGSDALLQRILYRLTAHRGQFAPLPELGSRLYLLGREPASQRLSAARQYVAEALRDEDVTVEDVILAPSPSAEGRIRVLVVLDYQGANLTVTLTV